MRAPLIEVHMACNDPDNGEFIGRVCQISVQNDALELVAKCWDLTSSCRVPKLRNLQDEHTFVLSGKRWPFVRTKAWVGNWCWDGYAMTADIATAFLVWLHRRSLFKCEGGWVELCDAWEARTLVLADGWWAL